MTNSGNRTTGAGSPTSPGERCATPDHAGGGNPGPSDILLRDVVDGDLPIFFEHQLDPDAIQMAAFASRDRDAFMAHWTKILGDATTTNKTILFGGQVAGYVSCFVQSGVRLVGYWIGKAYWGQGIATRALSEFLKHVEARPLYAYVAKHNIASYRVLAKCGFTLVGEEIDSSHSAGEEAVEELILALGAHEQATRHDSGAS